MKITVSAKDCAFESFSYVGETPRKGDYIQFWDARFLVESVTRVLAVEHLPGWTPTIEENGVLIEAFKCETK